MRRSLILPGVLFLGLWYMLPVMAQIPNAGFESWTAGVLDGWVTSNTPIGNTITPTTTAHSGSYAIPGDVLSVGPGVIQPLIQSGPGGHGFVYRQRPAAFTGYYQFFPAASSGDRFTINVVLFKGGVNGIGVGVAAAALPNSVSSWTQFTTPFVYQTNDVPHTCIVQIQIVGPSTSVPMPKAGTYFPLDDLALSGSSTAVDGDADRPVSFGLEQNYPNPFNPITEIRYSVARAGHVALKIYNVLGAEVTSLVSEQKEEGTFSVHWNVGGLPSGIYVYRMAGASENGMLFDQTKKMMLIK